MKSGEKRADSGGKRSTGYRDKVCDLIGAMTDAEAKFPTFYSLNVTEFEILRSISNSVTPVTCAFQMGNAPN